MRQNDLLQQIASAKSEITSAQDAVHGVLHEMQVSVSGEEVGISQVAEDAFERLRGARGSLADLEKQLSAEQ
ncbi:MAG: hypothetical protein U1A78_40165 [Polyangia bacterium]